MQTECLSVGLTGMLVIISCLIGFFLSTKEPVIKLHISKSTD